MSKGQAELALDKCRVEGWCKSAKTKG